MLYIKSCSCCFCYSSWGLNRWMILLIWEQCTPPSLLCYLKTALVCHQFCSHFTCWSQRTACLSAIWSVVAFRSSWPSALEWAARSLLRTSRCGCGWLSPKGQVCWHFVVNNNTTKSKDIFNLKLRASLPAQRTWGLLPCLIAPCLPK